MLATILYAQTTVVDHGRRPGGAGQESGQAARGQIAETRELIRGHRGRLIRTTTDGILATFDAPGQAIRCAAAVRDGAAAAGIQIRAGIHTGEVDLVGDDIAGTSVQITDRVAALARPAEILVSRTVKDLVAGSGITFAERGSHALNGPSDEWPLFAVTGFTAHLSSPDGRPGKASDGGCCAAKNAPVWQPLARSTRAPGGRARASARTPG